MDESCLKERLIRFARERYDMGQTRFEIYTDIPNGMINKITKGINTVNLAKIASKCPELNLRWLLLGEGEMLVSTVDVPSDIQGCLDIIRRQEETINLLARKISK